MLKELEENSTFVVTTSILFRGECNESVACLITAPKLSAIIPRIVNDMHLIQTFREILYD